MKRLFILAIASVLVVTTSFGAKPKDPKKFEKRTFNLSGANWKPKKVCTNPKCTKWFMAIEAPVLCRKFDKQGKCIRWGGAARGCKAPANGSCTATVNYIGQTHSCTAKNGDMCIAVIELQDQQWIAQYLQSLARATSFGMPQIPTY